MSAASEALAFYTAALPQIEALLAMAREWRDRAPTDPEAIRAHGEMFWLACRVDLRLGQAAREDRVIRHPLSTDRTRAPAVPGAPPPGGTTDDRC